MYGSKRKNVHVAGSLNYSTDGIGTCVIKRKEVVFMETLWEIKKEVITPEEVVARINKLVESWAAEEKAEALQRAQRKDHNDHAAEKKGEEGSK